MLDDCVRTHRGCALAVARMRASDMVNLMIHFTNGSIVADALAAGGVPGRVVVCADPCTTVRACRT